MNSLGKLLLPILVCCSLSVISGCWSAVELNNRAFARIMLIDKAEDGIELTLGFPLPNRMSSGKTGGGDSGGSSNQPFTFISKTGKDIGDAYRKIQSDVPRRITFGQLRNVLLGNKFARQGIGPIADFLARETGLHINANLFVTEGKVKDFAKIPLVFERFPTDILTAYAETKVLVPVTLKDMLMSVYNGGDLLLPRLAFGNKGAEFEEKGEKWMSTNGAAIIRRGRMVGTLDTQETRAALWILGELENSEFTIDSPKDGKEVDFLVWGARTKIKPKLSGRQISIDIRCNASATLLASASTINVTDVEQLDLLEKKLENQLTDRIAKAIDQTKSVKSDAFQLGNLVEWWYPRRWKQMEHNWRDLYKTTLRVDPQVDIAIKRYGTAQKPEWNRVFLPKEDSN